MASELRTLTRQRASAKSQLTRLTNYVKDPTDLEIPELEVRKQKLEECYANFYKIQSEIDKVDEASDSEATKAEFEVAYYSCADLIGRKIRDLNLNSISQTTSTPDRISSSPSTAAQSIAPKVHIKPFNGNPVEWRGFYETFRSVVHENDSVLIINKFHLLNSYLIGDASSVISQLSASEDNYFVAWELVQKRFNKPRKIIQGHIRALFELPEVIKGKPASLRALSEAAEMHIHALRSLKQPVDWDEMTIYIVSAKLDKETRTSWERTVDDDVMPKFTEFISFLNKYARDDEPVRLITHPRDTPPRRYPDKYTKPTHKVNSFATTNSTSSCIICNRAHYIGHCDEFLNQSPPKRTNTIKSLKRCVNCLTKGHNVSQCRSSNCRKCDGRHHTLLHDDNVHTNRPTDRTSPIEVAPTTVTLTACDNLSTEVLLSTARVKILDINHKEHECRVLLDPGSQRNFITERFASHLRLPKTRVNISTSGIGRQESQIKYAVQAQIKSKFSDFKCNSVFLTMPEITNPLPSQTFNQDLLRIPSDIPLADSTFNKSAAVDLLLGEHLFYQLLGNARIRLDEKVILQQTGLGWIISGEIDNRPSKGNCLLSVQKLDLQLERFWQLEEHSAKKIRSPDEELCEQFFKQTVKRDQRGRYTVRLPFNSQKEQLGHSYELALKRFYALEKKLHSNNNLRNQYTEFLKEYETLGHMVELKDESTKGKGFYLPHHGVIKSSSLTTKLRVVFDASAKSSSGLSLNDALLVGPTIQDDVFRLVTRFRSHAYVLTADIEKMFRQIMVDPDDAVYQKILWRDNPNEAVRTYQLKTVTYGTASAPFLAVRCLQQLADDESDTYPLAADAIRNDFYMDDLLTGTRTLDAALKLRSQLINLLKAGGMNLRQWASNEPSLIDGLGERSSSDHLCLDVQTTQKTLGIYWHPRDDTISYRISTDDEEQSTKRTILSKIAQLFDPLGLLGPVILRAKLIMQQLWKCGVGWDDKVPSELQTMWDSYKEQLPLLNKFSVARETMVRESVEVQLHGFCDASELAYGAAIYVRSKNKQGAIRISLVAAKSRVAPLKTISIPRLELCAAELLCNLYHAVLDSFQIPIESVHFWSDSTIVLHWINTPPHTLKTFVANRVAKIQEMTNQADWKHVISADNPADSISRGELPTEFLSNQQWLTGPIWLSKPTLEWPITPILSISIPERRTIINLIATVDSSFLERFSSWKTLQRVTAYCIRFCKNASRSETNTGPLSIREISRAHNFILRQVQSQHFANEIKELEQGKPTPRDSKILPLTPFIDSDGLIRVGGRLQNANISYNQKHPILLPRSHHITNLIIVNEHSINMHAGILGTLNATRQKYWPIDGKNITRRVIRKCIRCFKVNPRDRPEYLMGNLPRDRVTSIRPFQTVGIDFCGPFYIKEKKFRNTKKVKVYVAIFICFATKAVHLELVSDLSTDAFLASLKRFFSRRGYARTIYSDNGTNFVGAKNRLTEMQKFLESEEQRGVINNELRDKHITWHFSPPRSPHFGGLWEAAVRSFKHHALRTVGDTLFTYEELNTYVIEIEAILNSRPLTALSPDPNDLSPLTPAHFLVGESLNGLPERDVSGIPTNRLSVWQHIQKVKQHFWARWYKEYLNELNIRSKWRHNPEKSLKIGTLVLLKEDNIPAMQWSMGRITELHPGDDGLVRVVTLRTANHTYKRSVRHICPLPLDNNT